MFTSETVASILAIEKTVLLLSLVVNVWAFTALFRHARGRPSDWGLSGMLLGLFGWTASILILFMFAAAWAAYASFFCAAIALTGFAWFSLVYPEERVPKYAGLMLAPGIVVAVLSLIPHLFINGLRVTNVGYLSLVRNQPLAIFSLYTILACVVPTATLFLKARSERNIVVRQRLKWIATASLITFFAALFTNVLLPNLFAFPYLNGIGPVFSMILATIVVWITTYKHYVDATNVFSLVSGRIALIASTVLVFSGIMITLLASATDPFVAQTASIVSTGIFILALGPSIRSAGEDLVRPYKEGKGTRHDADTREFVDALSQTTTTAEITTEIHRALESAVHPQHATLTLADVANAGIATLVAALAEERALAPNPPAVYITDELPFAMLDAPRSHRDAATALGKALNATVIIPILYRRDIIGVLSLGPKKNGEGYSRRDSHLLAAYARAASPFLVRASIIEHAERVAQRLEEEVATRTRAIARAQQEERELIHKLGIHIAGPFKTFLLATKAREEGRLHDLGEIEAAMADSERAIKALLDFTATRGSAFGADHLFNLSDVVDGCVKEALPHAKAIGASLMYEIAPNALVVGDALVIRDAIERIIDNAFRYLSNSRPPAVVIKLETNETTALLTIEDNGLGIAQDALDRIGTPFTHARRDDPAQGIGLSLSIVRSTVARHSGMFSMESAEGVRTIVRIGLPLAGR